VTDEDGNLTAKTYEALNRLKTTTTAPVVLRSTFNAYRNEKASEQQWYNSRKV
jgi:hypothetical protein